MDSQIDWMAIFRRGKDKVQLHDLELLRTRPEFRSFPLEKSPSFVYLNPDHLKQKRLSESDPKFDGGVVFWRALRHPVLNSQPS